MKCTKNKNLNIILEDLKTDVEYSDVLHPVDIINELILDPRTFSKDNYNKTVQHHELDKRRQTISMINLK